MQTTPCVICTRGKVRHMGQVLVLQWIVWGKVSVFQERRMDFGLIRGRQRSEFSKIRHAPTEKGTLRKSHPSDIRGPMRSHADFGRVFWP